MATLKTVLDLNNAETVRGFAEAAAAVGRYTGMVERASATSLEKWLRQSEALRLEADGQREAAAALREKLEIEERAVKLAKQTGISLESANALITRRIMLEKQLAAQQSQGTGGAARRGRDIGLPAMDLTTAEMNRAAVATDRVNQRMREMRQAGKNGSMGFLAFSQAVEDAQYGIRGVLNNIPQMIMGFGGTMGLAGALSLAAVAGVSLYPVLKRLYGAADTERLKAASDAWRDIFEQGMKATAEFSRERDILRETNGYLTEMRNATQSRVTLQEVAIRGLEADVKIRQEAVVLANELTAAQQRLDQARGQGGAGNGEAQAREMQDLQADLAARKAIADAAFEESERLRQGRESLAGSYAEELEQQSKEIERLLGNLAGAEANVAAAKKEQEQKGLAGADLASARIAEKASTAARDRIALELEQLKAKRAALAALAEQQNAEAKAGESAMSAKVQAATEEAQALDRLIDQRKQLFQIQQETAKAEKEAEAAKRNKSSKSDLADLLAAADEANRKKAGGIGLKQEMEVLRLRAAGREKEAEALQREFTARSEAVRIARETNLSEEDALRIVRERQELEDQISRQKEATGNPARRRGGIYKKESNNIGGFGQIGFSNPAFRASLGSRVGLGSAAADRARESRPRDPNADARRAAQGYYEKNLQQNEELLQIWRTLGVA